MTALARDVAAAIDDTAAQLARAGIERARAEARLLVAKALDCGVATIVADPSRAVSAGLWRRIEALAARRTAHEPIAYILGHREFYSLDFAVTPAVLIPRPDSEALVDAVLGSIDNQTRPLRLLDLGTGSGCLLLALLNRLPNASGIGLDRSAAALDVARANAQALGLAARCSWIDGEWSTARTAAPFDIVVSNPPYIPSAEIATLEPDVAAFEPHLALDGGPDGLDAVRLIVPLLPQILAQSGTAALEVGRGQSGPVSAMMKASNLLNIRVYIDLSGVERVVVGQAIP